jgi:oligoribonuclease
MWWVVTDLNFEVLDTYHRIVRQPQAVLDTMNEWCKNTHGKSGLTALVPNGTPLVKVEQELIELTDKHFPQTGKNPEKIVLCGNSVGMDKRFIDRYMKKFAERLHYRLVDVTSFKEIFRSKYGKSFEKKEGHRALDDIHESINELRFYLQFVKA